MREYKSFWDKNAGRYDRFMQGSLKHPILIYLIISDRTFLNCFLF